MTCSVYVQQSRSSNDNTAHADYAHQCLILVCHFDNLRMKLLVYM